MGANISIENASNLSRYVAVTRSKIRQIKRKKGGLNPEIRNELSDITNLLTQLQATLQEELRVEEEIDRLESRIERLETQIKEKEFQVNSIDVRQKSIQRSIQEKLESSKKFIKDLQVREKNRKNFETKLQSFNIKQRRIGKKVEKLRRKT